MKLGETLEGSPFPASSAPFAYYLAALTIKDINVLTGQIPIEKAFNFGVQAYNDEPVPKYWNRTVFKEAIGRGSGSRYPKNRAQGDRGRVIEPWLTSSFDCYE